jgi:hypothetical protein
VQDKAADLQHQDRTYRRGLVLGLTMAEVMVLVLFTLLLALADSIKVRNDRIADLRQQMAAIELLISDAGPGVSVADIIQRLDRQKEEIAQLKKDNGRLPDLEAKAAALDDLVKTLQAGGSGKSDIEKLIQSVERGAAAARENANLRGQNTQLSEQIKRSGKGNEFPSCWATSDGKPESIFEVTLRSTGLMVHDRALNHRKDEQALLPLKKVAFDTELSREQFSDQLRPLYQWSVDQNCRFYIIRFAAEKAVVSDLVNVIDGFFYPDSFLRYRPTQP